MNTLNTIQTLSKIGRVLSKLVYICCVIGAVGCAVGMASLPFADSGILKIGGVTIYGLIVNRADIELNSLYPLMTGALIICVGQAVTAKFAQGYFLHELVAGTPFTLSGAKELFRLGVITICVPLGSLMVAQIVSGILAGFLDCGDTFQTDSVDSVTLGVMFLFMSLLCQYGAECEERRASEGN